MAIVPTIVAGPPPHSLLRAADTTHDADPDWQRGLEYAPEAVGGYRALSGCTAQVLDFGTGGRAPVVEYRPWELMVEDPCTTTFGYDQAAMTARLGRAVDAIESYAIARELWTGELSTADADADDDLTPNAALTRNPTVVGSGPVSPRRGLGLLEGAVGDALHGQQAYLHISRTARPFFAELVKVGQLLFTNLDNFIVADAGYPGTAPDGEAAAADVAWIYATGPVVVRRTALFSGPSASAEVIDTATNTVRRTAGKLVAATFDPASLFAVPITLA